MLSRDDNELMCRVGPGTAMGIAMRRNWVPALMASELPEAGGDPVHVELLGENFVAFRDGGGNIGLLDEHCCHRGASLAVGRVEQCGIRCIYHGWLFDADGKVLDTPNTSDERFKDRFKARSYPFREAGGLLWTYLGEIASMPPFPDYQFIGVPESNRLPTLMVVNASFMQIMEGIFDSSHLSLLHASSLGSLQGGEMNFIAATSHMLREKSPQIDAEETDFGMHYAALRTIDGKQETRITAFIAPFFQLNPNGDLWSALIPMADNKTAFYQVWFSEQDRFGEDPLRIEQLTAAGLTQDMLESHGMTRRTFFTEARMMRENGWHQDRQAMRDGHWTGMRGLVQEDALCFLSGGNDGIRDRTYEHLCSSDLAIAMIYRILLRSARNVLDGKDPVGAGVPVGHVRATFGSLEPGTDWRTLVPQHKPKRSAAQTPVPAE